MKQQEECGKSSVPQHPDSVVKLPFSVQQGSQRQQQQHSFETIGTIVSMVVEAVLELTKIRAVAIILM